MTVVTARSNPRVKEIRRLLTPKGRRELGRTIVEGPDGLAELLDAGLEPLVVVRTPDDDETEAVIRARGLGELVVTQDVLDAVSDVATPRGPVAVIDRPPSRALRARRTVVLVDVADPGNVGTILRSADAFGWDAAVAGATADPWSPKALRSAAGATFGIHLGATEDPIGDCAAVGLTTIGLVVTDGDGLPDRDGPVALLVGSEAHGLDPGLVESADLRYTIPMPGGRESLNAAVAASIAMYALT